MGKVLWLPIRTTARSFVASWIWSGTRGELSVIDDLVDDEFTNFSVRRPGGHAGRRHIVTVWRTAFPGLDFEIQEQIVHEDTRVVTGGLMGGTHPGEFRQRVGPDQFMGAMPIADVTRLDTLGILVRRTECDVS